MDSSSLDGSQSNENRESSVRVKQTMRLIFQHRDLLNSRRILAGIVSPHRHGSSSTSRFPLRSTPTLAFRSCWTHSVMEKLFVDRLNRKYFKPLQRKRKVLPLEFQTRGKRAQIPYCEWCLFFSALETIANRERK
ncbi:hypothetical protein BgiMline_008499 [Biomphalaria glabrata]